MFPAAVGVCRVSWRCVAGLLQADPTVVGVCQRLCQ
jgi:hypothetical protein